MRVTVAAEMEGEFRMDKVRGENGFSAFLGGHHDRRTHSGRYKLTFLPDAKWIGKLRCG
jgi:hypothetical protein